MMLMFRLRIEIRMFHAQEKDLWSEKIDEKPNTAKEKRGKGSKRISQIMQRQRIKELKESKLKRNNLMSRS